MQNYLLCFYINIFYIYMRNLCVYRFIGTRSLNLWKTCVTDLCHALHFNATFVDYCNKQRGPSFHVRYSITLLRCLWRGYREGSFYLFSKVTKHDIAFQKNIFSLLRIFRFLGYNRTKFLLFNSLFNALDN